MGVIALDVVRPAVALPEDQLRAGCSDHHLPALRSSSVTHRKQRHRPAFRLQAHRVSTPRAAVKRPPAASVSVSEPPAAQLLHCSLDLDLESSSLPAPACGAQPLYLHHSGQRTAGADHVADDDWPLDYKEAAAALEQLFSDSPSLDTDRSVNGIRKLGNDEGALSAVSSKTRKGKLNRSPAIATKRSRKDLMARIALHRKKIGLEKGDPVIVAHASKSLGAVGVLSDSIWSEAASKLLQQHGEVVNLMAQNWSRLGRELLSAEEEVWLASLMKPAQALKKVKAKLRHQLGREVTQEEWAKASGMDLPTFTRHLALHHAARNKLVKLNLRLVRHKARQYEKDAPGSNLTAEELCQEGVKGLIVAVDRFEPAKGKRFSSYAMFWIRNSILRAQTRSGHPIRAPFNFAEMKMNVRKVMWEMKLEGEVASGKANKSSMKKILERAGVDEERYKVVMRSNRRLVSLHKRHLVTGEELVEHLADPKSLATCSGSFVGHADHASSLRLGIDDVLDSLKPKESLVLRQRFGLDGKGERALGEIGRNMRMSREMVRQYEVRGLLKLKHPTRLEYLRSFLS